MTVFAGRGHVGRQRRGEAPGRHLLHPADAHGGDKLMGVGVIAGEAGDDGFVGLGAQRVGKRAGGKGFTDPRARAGDEIGAHRFLSIISTGCQLA